MKKELFLVERNSRRLIDWLPFCVLLIAVSVLFFCCNIKGSKNDDNSSSAELDGLKVPPGFTIERVAAPGMLTYPMFASFDGKGRLFVFESDGSSPSTEDMLKKPPYHIRMLEDTNGDGIFDKSIIFADSLSFPKGGVFYNGSLYVTASPDMLRLTDTDGDGVADKREVVLTGWVLNHNGALLGGPFLGPDGWMYLTDARRGFDITTKEGQELKGNSARIWRCRPDGSGLESMAGGGYDNAIELAFMPSGETIGTMTYFIEPQGGMRDAIMHWVEGGVYPKPLPVIAEDHLKLTGDLMPVMTKMARVAPSGLMRYRGSALGKEFTGNFFSAEFNTGRIMRHQISPAGATYKTIDEPFITSTVSDIHLTDVFEDADGSMLVINTGGWFIAGCPLSRVAKLNIQGGLYRIRKIKTDHMEDPWGRKLDLSTMPPETIAGKITDSRFAVRDNVVEKLIQMGPPAIAPLKNSFMLSGDPEIRTAGIFALSRINTADAWKEVRTALEDTNALVRTAAARVLGLAKDKQAVNKLIQLVQTDKLPVRRQAATALGQIGDTNAANALLNAVSGINDRFVEHAVIYSLITLKNIPSLNNGLTNSSPDIRKAALIALDQMDGSPLQKQDLEPFLASEDAQIRNTGIWVASHHPDWASIIIGFLQMRLNRSDISKTDAASLSDLMITFSENKQLQEFLGVLLGNIAAPPARTELLLNVISHSAVKEVPPVWIRPLGKLLQTDNPAIRSQVLSLIGSRRITALNIQLKEIVDNPRTPGDFRLKALTSLLVSDARLSDPEFMIVMNYLDSINESPVRQLAARVLAQAKLSNVQLIRLAKEQVARTDVFLLPNLVGAFQGNSNEEVGEAFVAALGSSSNRLDNLSEPDIEQLFHNYPQSIKTRAEPLIVKLREKNADRLSQLQAVEAGLKRGDVGQGRKLFFGKAICSTCHAIGTMGGNFAPDLTNIGQIRAKHDILEAILYPSASFAREHETSKVITKTTSYTGIIKEQLPEAIIVATGPGQQVRVQRSEITRIEPQSISMMPPGLDKQLTNEELSDLIAYLTSLPDGMGGHGNEH